MKQALLFIAILFVLFAGGCRGGGPGSQTRPTPISAPAAAEGGGSADEGGGVGQDIALRLWAPQNETAAAAFQALANAYIAANPGVAVTIETFDAATYEQALQNALAAGTAGDVVQIPGGSTCAAAVYLAPVPEIVTTLANAQAVYLEGPLGSFVCDNALYGLPQESSAPWGLAVSKTGRAQDVAWDFARFAALDPANAAAWNAATGTPAALGSD